MRLVPRPQERRPEPAPLRTDDRTTVLVGTIAWAVLLASCLVFLDDLQAAGRAWWAWACACGVVLGLIGLAYVHLRRPS